MLDIADRISSAIQSGDILWLTVALAAAAILNYSKFAEYFAQRKKQPIDRLRDAIDCPHLDEEIKEFFRNELGREYFLYTVGISADKEYRSELIRLHGLSKGELPFMHFRRASQHMNFERGRITVNLSAFDYISHAANMIMASACGLIALTLFTAPAFVRPISLIQMLTLYGFGVLFVLAVGLFLLQSRSIYSAKLVKEYLATTESASRTGIE